MEGLSGDDVLTGAAGTDDAESDLFFTAVPRGRRGIGLTPDGS